MTPNKKTDAISRLREVAPQEPEPADDAAKLRVHHVSLARDVRLMRPSSVDTPSFGRRRTARASPGTTVAKRSRC